LKDNASSIPFFSIIVPVYNDEIYLSRCLDSIYFQNFIDFECLIIDDGSTDNCPLLCDQYSKKDKRFHVFHKDNEGISKTRHFGITNAIGNYIVFVDSDDRIDSNFLFIASQTIDNEKPEIIFMDFFEENYFRKEKYNNQKPQDTNVETILKLVLERKLYSCLWNVIIKRDLFLHNNIKFCDTVNYGEDSLFILELLLNNPKITYQNGAYYHHSYNYNSFTRRNLKQRYIERVKFLNLLPILLDIYNRNDLIAHNFFPLYDKYEMLFSMVFSRKEYQSLFSPVITFYFLKKTGFKKYIMLCIAETKLYSLLIYYIKLKVFIKNIIGKFYDSYQR